MKFILVCFVTIVFLSVISDAFPSKGSTKASLKKKPCLKSCDSSYKPICAGETQDDKHKISFGNECVLSNYNCENGKELKIQSQGECPGGGGVRLS